jgi:hypothetical protein
MVFIETDSFNKAITTLMQDEAYAKLQQALVDDPEFGDLIPGTGGMRKVRWTLGGKGKRRRSGDLLLAGSRRADHLFDGLWQRS